MLGRLKEAFVHTCDKYQNFMCWTHILLTVINILKLQRKVLIEAFNRTVAAFHDAKSVDKVKKETYTGKFCLFVALHPSQQLWSLGDGLYT